ncbi:MAG: FGGY family carbohydrate kinase [Thermoanaerobacterales bacterium]|nr:FGGY family carbohydrate kinase [Thermoanaerobacterales bacterium]
MKNALIGIDIGSSNVKVVIFNEKGQILASETQEHTTLIPRPGWTEYMPDEWWEITKNLIQRAINKANVDPKNIAGIGVSSLGACPVPMDKDGKVVYNGIPWSDQRADKEVNFLIEQCGEEIFRICKVYPNQLNTIPAVLWIKNNEPEVYERIHKFTEPSGFLVQRLTGEFTLDISFAACMTFGMDAHTLKWDKDLIEKMGLDIEKFPRLHANMDEVGKVTQKAAEETGLVPGTPVYSGGPDYTPTALAAGVLHPGQTFISMGSGANVIALTDDQEICSKHLLSIIHAKGPQIRMLDGLQGSIGYSMKWFRDQLGGLEAIEAQKRGKNVFDIMTEEAKKTEPGSGGVIYIPYLYGKFLPEMNSHARAVFFGINGATTRAQLIRAVMEGTSFDMYESLNVLIDTGLEINDIIVTGGPSNSDLWCQIIADVMNRRIVVVHAPEAAAFGDAILTGVGTGVFESFEEVAEKYIKVKRTHEPNPKNHELYQELYEIYKDIYKANFSIFERLDKCMTAHAQNK